MAVIHRTTMKPTKGELLNHWLPKQSWYEGDAGGPEPELVNVGGFRLDDPQGEVGIEVMVVVDAGAPDPVAYLVPMGYRGAALEDVPAEALIGTSEHGVLGTRWIYDGAHDPVVTAQLRALLRGEAVAQHQNASDTPDPTVIVHGSDPDDAGHGGHGGHGHDEPDGRDRDEVRIHRVLRPSEAPQGSSVHLVAGWTWPDGTSARAVFATLAPR
ncbi:maltokinase N-terminal cap-like domain-containing protein [Streptomyces sp. NPDC002073]